MEWKISKKQQKYILTLLLSGALGIFLIVLGNGSSQETDLKLQEVSAIQERTKALTEEERLEQQLAAVLSHMEGVGSVQIKLTTTGSTQKTYAYNTQLTEKESIEPGENGERKNQEQQENQTVVMRSTGQGMEEPLLVEEVRPEINGVLVIATGAGDSRIRAQITQAIETVLNVPAHKVLVLAGKQ